MLSHKEFQDEVNKAKGVDPQVYQNKIKWLFKKWEQADYSTETEDIGPILISTPSPLNTALIADNLTYFKKHYAKDLEYSKQGLELALKRACLCGSQQIGEFLLKKLNATYTQNQYNYILGYLSASPNTKWMEKVARTLSEANVTMPSAVLRLAPTEALINIEKIFKGNSTSAPQKLPK